MSCHPAYAHAQVDEESNDGWAVFDSGALDTPAGFITTFTRAGRNLSDRKHHHIDILGDTITHSHPHAGGVHAHITPLPRGAKTRTTDGTICLPYRGQ